MGRSPTSVGIVGAGPGGLASAVVLAASGARVAVYEAAPGVGGRTGRVRLGGFAFDRGPTFFLMPHVLDEVFAAAGRRLRDEVDLTRLDPMYRVLVGHGDGTARAIDATQDLDAMSRRLSAIHPPDGARLAPFMAHNRAKLRHSEAILRSPMRSALDLLGPGVWRGALAAGPLLLPHLSVHELIARHFEHRDVRLAMSFQSKYLGMSPFQCPSLFTILPYIEYAYGVWHVAGGCHELMLALERVARGLGVEVHTSTPVERVAIERTRAGRRASGVVVGGSEVAHDHVVINADATWAMKHLLGTDSPRACSPARVDAMRYSCSTCMLYLGVRGGVDLPHHTIYVSARYEENLREIGAGALSVDPSIYACHASATDPSMAPAGCSSLYLLMPCPNLKAGEGLEWRGAGSAQGPAAAAARELMLDQAGERLGIERLRERIEVEAMATPEDWRDQRINVGATFNLAHDWGQLLHRRPGNRLRGYENVYLVGGGTHPGSGLPTIFLSAQIAARLVCDAAGLACAGDCAAARAIASRGEAREPTGVAGRHAALAGGSV